MWKIPVVFALPAALPAAITMTDSVLVKKAIFGNWLIRVLSKPNRKAQLLKIIGNTDDAGAKALATLPGDALPRERTDSSLSKTSRPEWPSCRPPR